MNLSNRLLVFDCDSTLSAIEGIDELGALRGPEIGRKVEALTNRAMAGELPIEQVFPLRMEMIRPTRAECTAIGRRYIERAEPHARAVVRELQGRGWQPAILSGGFAPVIAPFADWLGIAEVAAVPLHFDTAGNYLDFGRDYPTTRNGGKPELIRQMRQRHGAQCVVMVGDGVSDLETAPVVERFIGFGRFVLRPAVQRGAAYFLTSLEGLPPLLRDLEALYP